MRGGVEAAGKTIKQRPVQWGGVLLHGEQREVHLMGSQHVDVRGATTALAIALRTKNTK
jgi:hypothetical protein